MTRGPIAASLGMQSETLSRALVKLRPLGVATKGSRLTIRDVQALHHCVRRDG
jgi:hypothetical protein